MAAAAGSVPLRLLNPHTREAYDLDLFIGDQWNMDAVRVCDWLMRDWRQSLAVQCDRKLYAALYVMQRYFAPDGRINLHSGYRTEQTNEYLREVGYGPAVHSQHLKAKAVDFSIPGVSMKNVARAVYSLSIGGTGLYEDQNFVHMDSRGTQVTWADPFM